MANNVNIGGVTVDIDDPCAYCAALKAIKARVMAGESISEVSAADGAAQRRYGYNPPASIEEINKAISIQADLCAKSSGGRPSRFAMRAGFRTFP